MEFENDVKAVVAEMAEALNKNYSDQKLFDLSLGERLPQKDEIIDFVDELRKVTFPGFFGRENMAYANKEYPLHTGGSGTSLQRRRSRI